MATFPGAEATFTGFTSSHTLLADSHASQHNLEQGEIVATQHKLGTGASTPTSGVVLRGNGVGASTWGQAVLTTDVTGVLPQANGGTGTTLATGTGKAVYDTTPTVSNPTITGGGSWAGSPTLTTPTIADFTNATHTHANAAGGGQLNGTNAITAATLAASVMKYGMVRERQGGTSGDNAWNTTGTNNTDTSAKDVFIQVGTTTSSGGGSATVTFPVAFTKAPVVFLTVIASSNGFFAELDSAATTTTFAFTCWSATAALAAKDVQWIAIGQ